MITNAMITPETVDVDFVFVPDRLRPITDAAVEAMAVSLAEVGLLTPITLREVEKMVIDGKEVCSVPVLVAGACRLAAAKKLGWERIAAVFIDGDETDFRLLEIAENLHRSELTALERAEHLREWVRLTAEKSSAQVGPVKTRRADGRGGAVGEGLNAAIKEIGITRQEGQRAVKIAEGQTPEAKAAVVTKGLDNNQSVLLAVARTPADQQLAKIEAFAAGRKPDRSASARPTPSSVTEKRHSAAEQLAAKLATTIPENEWPALMTCLSALKYRLLIEELGRRGITAVPPDPQAAS